MHFHGDGFEIIRNNFFDATGAYNPTVPIDQENNYGFTIGGPVIIPKLYNGKNRTFFHLSMEWYRQNQTQTGIFSLPTAAEKAGRFQRCDSTANNPIFNPAAGLAGSCTANGNTRERHSSAISSRQPASAQLPRACCSTFPIRPCRGLRIMPVTRSGLFPTRQNPWGFTIDHNITESNQFTGPSGATSRPRIGGNAAHLALGKSSGVLHLFPRPRHRFHSELSLHHQPHLVMTAGASWLGELNFQIPSRTGAQPTFAAAPGAPIVPGINFSGPLSPDEFRLVQYQFHQPETGHRGRKQLSLDQR